MYMDDGLRGACFGAVFLLVIFFVVILAVVLLAFPPNAIAEWLTKGKDKG